MSHYNWLDENFQKFFDNINVNKEEQELNCGIISAHGDKCYSYRDRWKINGIPFEHGVALYLLTYINPWSNEVRMEPGWWVDPWRWVIDNYKLFKKYLPKV